MSRSLAALLVAGCVLSVSAYADPPAGPADGAKPAEPAMGDASKGLKTADAPAPTKEEIADWTSRLQKIAANYKTLSRVDDLSRWAPTACAMPRGFPRVPMSAADPKATEHGEAYALWAKDVESYGKMSGFWLVAWPDDGKKLDESKATEGLAQVLVKESFEAIEMKPEEKDRFDPDDSILKSTQTMRPAYRDGKRYKAGAPKGLFVMMGFERKPASSDDGWIYGTMSPDGAVTAVGRVESCMACHTTAPHGRLFGLAHAEEPAAKGSSGVSKPLPR